MSGRKLDITERQMRVLISAAKKAGLTPIVRVGNTAVELVPADRVVTGPAPAKVDGKGAIRL